MSKINSSAALLWAWLAVAVAAVAVAVVAVTGDDAPARPGVVTVNVERLPSDDCEYVVGHRDTDGRPGGATVPRVGVDCP